MVATDHSQVMRQQQQQVSQCTVHVVTTVSVARRVGAEQTRRTHNMPVVQVTPVRPGPCVWQLVETTGMRGGWLLQRRRQQQQVNGLRAKSNTVLPSS